MNVYEELLEEVNSIQIGKHSARALLNKLNTYQAAGKINLKEYYLLDSRLRERIHNHYNGGNDGSL